MEEPNGNDAANYAMRKNVRGEAKPAYNSDDTTPHKETTMAIRIDTNRYKGTHGHTPHQPRQYRTSPWAFQIDSDPTPVCITASYKEAVKQAKAMAVYSIIVLP